MTADRKAWKILLVDDEIDVIEVSRMVLEDLVFEDKPMAILTAQSGAEAREVFAREDDIAIAFIDVVMETEHAGLELVKFVREKLRNDRTRLILRTGNPGAAPQTDVVRYLEIDDYKEKTELTADRLGTSVMTSLRAYRNLIARVRIQNGLQAIIQSTDSSEDDPQVQFAKIVEQCDLMTQQVTGLACHGAVYLWGRAGLRKLDTFGPGPSPTPDAQRDGAITHAIAQALESPVLGAVRPTEVAGGLLLGDRPHPSNGLFLWLEGLNLSLQEEHLNLLQLFLGFRAGGLTRTVLQREVVAAQSEVLHRLCEAVETRSKETGAHIRRIAQFSRHLARLKGLSLEQQKLIEMASPMHDIGKVAIPDDILHKPGKLNDDEWTLMKSHAEVGHRLLAHAEFPVMQAAAELAYHHHERWDGHGYPRGLSGEAIPVSGRIVALVDVFDALLSRRAYKEPWPLARVTDEIRRLRGSHFDPELVDLLVQNIHDFHTIYLSLPDQADAHQGGSSHV